MLPEGLIADRETRRTTGRKADKEALHTTGRKADREKGTTGIKSCVWTYIIVASIVVFAALAQQVNRELVP